MKASVLKRLAVLFMALILTFSLSACSTDDGGSSSEDGSRSSGSGGDATGTKSDSSKSGENAASKVLSKIAVDRADSTSGKAINLMSEGVASLTNEKSEMELSFKLSPNAKPISFAEFVNKMANLGEMNGSAADREVENILATTEFGLKMAVEVNDGDIEIAVEWLGINGYEDIVTIVMIDETIYISATIIDALAATDMAKNDPEAAADFSMLACDYIEINLGDLPSFLYDGLYEILDILDVMVGELVGDLESELDGFIEGMISEMLGGIELDHRFGALMTSLGNAAISQTSSGFNFNLNSNNIADVLTNIISAIEEHEDYIKFLLPTILRQIGMGQSEINGVVAIVNLLDLSELAQMAGMLADEITDMIDFDISVSYSDTASRTAFDLSVYVAMDDLPPGGLLSASIKASSSDSTRAIRKPSGDILTFNDLAEIFGF